MTHDTNRSKDDPLWARLDQIAARSTQRLLVPLAAGAASAFVGLLSKTVSDDQCLTLSENVAGERCDELHGHPLWFYYPSAAVLVIAALVVWFRPRRWIWIAAITVGVLVAIAVLISPYLWVDAAPVSGP